jgi:hypothetical protein
MICILFSLFFSLTFFFYTRLLVIRLLPSFLLGLRVLSLGCWLRHDRYKGCYIDDFL